MSFDVPVVLAAYLIQELPYYMFQNGKLKEMVDNGLPVGWKVAQEAAKKIAIEQKGAKGNCETNSNCTLFSDYEILKKKAGVHLPDVARLFNAEMTQDQILEVAKRVVEGWLKGTGK